MKEYKKSQFKPAESDQHMLVPEGKDLSFSSRASQVGNEESVSASGSESSSPRALYKNYNPKDGDSGKNKMIKRLMKDVIIEKCDTPTESDIGPMYSEPKSRRANSRGKR